MQKKIIEKRVKEIYICLDADAIRNALSIAKRFMGEGLNVYFIELKTEDASDLGFHRITEIIEETGVMTFEQQMQLQIEHIWK
mgnify:FL=1